MKTSVTTKHVSTSEAILTVEGVSRMNLGHMRQLLTEAKKAGIPNNASYVHWTTNSLKSKWNA